MKTTNPLAVLGLLPAALQGKSDEQVVKLIQLVGRALLQVEHPDAGGNPGRFQAIKEAVDFLKDPQALAHAKRDYLKKEKPKVLADKLRLELLDAEGRYHTSQRRLQSFLEVFRMTGLLPSVPEGTMLEMRMHDTVTHTQERHLPRGISKRTFRTIRVTRDGMEDLTDGSKKIERIPLGCMPRGPQGIAAVMDLMRGDDIPTYPKKLQKRLRFSGGAGLPAIDSHRVPWGRAVRIIGQLELAIIPEAYLFSFEMHQGKPCIYLEGFISALKTGPVV